MTGVVAVDLSASAGRGVTVAEVDVTGRGSGPWRTGDVSVRDTHLCPLGSRDCKVRLTPISSPISAPRTLDPPRGLASEVLCGTLFLHPP